MYFREIPPSGQGINKDEEATLYDPARDSKEDKKAGERQPENLAKPMDEEDAKVDKSVKSNFEPKNTQANILTVAAERDMQMWNPGRKKTEGDSDMTC